MFRPIIRTDKNANIQSSYHCVRFFHAFFVADRCVMARLQSVDVRHVYSSFPVQLRHKSFVFIPVSSLVETHVFRLTSRTSICTRSTSYLYTLSTQNITRDKLWNTCMASQHLGTFIKPDRDEGKPSQKRLWIWHTAAWANS